MSTALINKYRPQSFDEVHGHSSQILALDKALANKRAHTFLFTGPSGIGKTTLARLTAKKAGCDPIDIQEIDAATNTGIDAMRIIADGMNYGPIASKAKAIIVDEVHALSKQAFQSLLKSLEEPPSWGYWLLCTTEPTRVPVAVKNRCFHVTLRPFSKTALVDMLKSIAETEGIKNKRIKDIINLCAEQADGIPRQAIANLAVAAEARNVDEAAELIDNVSEEANAAIDLARAIIRANCTWRDIQPILVGLKNQNGESIRHVVRAYATSVMLNSNNLSFHAISVLEAFSQPYYPQDGISPVLISCAKLLRK